MPPDTGLTAAVALLIFVPMIIEARRARRHERIQLARGGQEPPGDVHAVMQWAYPGAFLAMLVEMLWRGHPADPRVLAAGAGIFVAAKALKWWAILALGEAWTFRVITVPGARLVASGPYRLVRHPNYVAVAGELAGASLVTGAWVAGPVATGIFLLLVARRIAVEARALDAILARQFD